MFLTGNQLPGSAPVSSVTCVPHFEQNLPPSRIGLLQSLHPIPFSMPFPFFIKRLERLLCIDIIRCCAKFPD